MRTQHILKCWPEFFDAIRERKKWFDVRRCDDRSFKVGDEVVLKRFDPIQGKADGNCEVRTVGYILTGGRFGIEEGFCVLGLEIGPLSEWKGVDEVSATVAKVDLASLADARNLEDLRAALRVISLLANQTEGREKA